MNILVTANHVPFVRGGADYHVRGLVEQLRGLGHAVELLRLPFRFQPEADVERAMAFWEGFDLNCPNGAKVEKLISLQFPGYGARHEDHVVWLMHQHRAVYELYQEAEASHELSRLRERVHAFDNRCLAAARRLFANSARVAARLQQYNGLEAEVLYHPPYAEERFYSAPAQPYVFCPSRLESLKRQDLLIEAARYLRSPVKIIIAGAGGQAERYKALVERYRLGERVRLVGVVTEAEKLAWYAHALAVFFAPYDEDYGYVTLEAMLSERPVITASDSGGPLEFVQDGATGRVIEPSAEAAAEAIDQLWGNRGAARCMGEAGRAAYREQGISWCRVTDSLLA